MRRSLRRTIRSLKLLPIPRRPGTYRVDDGDGKVWYSYWDGSVWGAFVCRRNSARTLRNSYGDTHAGTRFQKLAGGRFFK